MSKENCFFEDIFSAIFYLIFIVAAPIISVVLQFSFDDKTLYLSYLIAGFSLTYDYICLLSAKTINKRLWIEAWIAVTCVIAIAIIAIVRLSLIVPKIGQSITYETTDFYFILVLGIMVFINIFELGQFARYEYRKRYPKTEKIEYYGIAEGGKNI